MTTGNNTPSLAFIGFGEAGQAIAAGLKENGVTQITAWDILFPQTDGAALKQAAATIGAHIATDAADAVRHADIVIAAVTAASSVDAARSVAAHLTGTPFYLDINSVSPGRKQETARLIGTRARYVDVAIMAPIHPKRHQTPMHLAGPHANAVAPVLQALGMRLTLAGPEIGAAAAIKMIRGVIIKGMEALTEECFLAATRAGIVEEVAASLVNNYPSLDWKKIVDYNLERMANHGVRRAAEMVEVADTLREFGVEPLMTEAIVKRQHEMGLIGKQDAVRRTLEAGGAPMLEAISAATKHNG
jgi:3-hydroxyisobutyrate dehydrogenase-like beta-hydroxyacid dehydrogenase